MLAMLALTVVALLLPAAAPPDPVPGVLEITVAPAQLAPTADTAAVLLANPGAEPIRDVAIEVDAPPGVAVALHPAVVPLLAAGTSTLVEMTIDGQPSSRPATLVVRAEGLTDAGSIAALATAELTAATDPASVTLVGNTRITESSPADLQAVITNVTDAPIDVTLRAQAGAHDVRMAMVASEVGDADPGERAVLTLPARASTVVFVQVEARGTIRRGTTAVTVTAAVTAPEAQTPVEVTATRELDSVLAASDLLPGPLGVGALSVPGLAAVAAWLAVGRWDRRRLGLTPPGVAAQIWDNKLWFLAVAGASLVAIVGYDWGGGIDMLDSYDWTDLVVVSLGAATLAFGLAHLRVWLHRRQVPLITTRSDPIDVLRAAGRADPELHRLVYRISETETGLLVHRDRNALVLTPRIGCSRPDGTLSAPDVPAAVQAAGAGDFDGHWYPSGGEIAAPVAVVEAVFGGRSPNSILEYRDR